jgi:hypothetical protein
MEEVVIFFVKQKVFSQKNDKIKDLINENFRKCKNSWMKI